MVCINILEFRPVGFLSIVAFPGPSEAAVDPQESGSSGQILLSAVFLKELCSLVHFRRCSLRVFSSPEIWDFG